MVNQKIKQGSKQKSITISKTWLIVGITSLVVNVVLVALSIVGAVGYSTGELDYAIINKGITILCSDKFRNKITGDKPSQDISADEQKTRIAYIDYQCSRNGAETYYEQGYKNYAHSLGLKTEE